MRQCSGMTPECAYTESMRVRMAGTLIALAWLSVVYVSAATYLALIKHGGPGWMAFVAIPVALLAVLLGAIGAILAPPRMSAKGAWASATGSGLFVLPGLLLALGLLVVVVAR
jgi:hypothetical protein